MFKYLLVFIFTPSAYSACLGTSFQSLHGDECFQVWTQYLGFASAQSQCAFLSSGGNLASIHNTFDNQLVSGRILHILSIKLQFCLEKSTAALSQSTANTMVWLGGQDMFQLNQWEWMDNSNFTYKNWYPGKTLLLFLYT